MKKENKKKNTTEINKYICAGCRYNKRFPSIIRFAKIPGLNIKGIKLLKKRASKEK